MKILIRRNRFIGFLLILEFIVIICFSFLVFYCRISGVRRILTYFFLVLSVSISCLGLALIIEIVQVGVKEIEIFYIKV